MKHMLQYCTDHRQQIIMHTHTHTCTHTFFPFQSLHYWSMW